MTERVGAPVETTGTRGRNRRRESLRRRNEKLEGGAEAELPKTQPRLGFRGRNLKRKTINLAPYLCMFFHFSPF